MKNKSVIKNYMYNLYYQILLVFVPLILTPYLSRTLGPVSTGIFSYTLSITTYFILIGGLGINLYGQKEVAYVQDEKNERSKKFFEIFFLKAMLLSISMIFFNLTFCGANEYSIYYKILMLEIVANIFDITWFFQGMEDFKKIIFRNVIVKIFGLILTILFVKDSSDLGIYLLIYTITNLFGNLSLWISLKKSINFIGFSQLKPFSHVKSIIGLFIPQIAIQIYTVLDKTMLGSLIDNISEVGYYEYGQKIVQMVLMILTSIGTVMLPRISNLYAKGKSDDIRAIITRMFKIVFAISIPLMVGLIFVSDDFVKVFLGNGYEKSAIVIKCMAPILFFIGLSNVIGCQYFLPIKKHKEYTISVIVGAIINVILNFILIPIYFSYGAAIATTISEVFVLIIQVLYSKKDFDYGVIFKKIYIYIFSAIVMLIPLYLISLLGLNIYLKLISEVIFGSLTYFLILYALKEENVTTVINSFRRKKI